MPSPVQARTTCRVCHGSSLELFLDLGDQPPANALLTREELANMVGTATESIIRLLSEFKQDKLIDLQGRKIKIINIQGLIKAANLNKI